MAVIELASFLPFSDIHLAFLDQLAETIGIVLNMIQATMRTEELLAQSQGLDAGAAEQSEELQPQQEELKRANSGARAAGADAAGVRGAAPEAAGRAAADERGARGEGAAARRAERRIEQQEPRDRARARGARGEGGAARALLEVQERVPREHEPRAAHAAQLAAHPREAARRQRGREPHRQAGRVRGDDPPGGRRSARPHQRHPRPLEGRGREDGGPRRRRSCSPTCATTSSARSGRWPRRRGSSSHVEIVGRTCRPRSSPTSSGCSRC